MCVCVCVCVCVRAHACECVRILYLAPSHFVCGCASDNFVTECFGFECQSECLLFLFDGVLFSFSFTVVWFLVCIQYQCHS